MKQLKVLFTNADQLINKRDDLSVKIAGNEPDLIMVTEVIPKAQALPISPALLALPGYNLYASFDLAKPNLGESGCRGICIYAKEGLPSYEVTLHECLPSSMEQLWISLDLLKNDRLLIGCIYLSPSGDRHQGVIDLDQTLKLACDLNPSHLLVAGDFNVPQIDWTTCYSEESPGHHSRKLISCVQDHFLTQHVSRPT